MPRFRIYLAGSEVFEQEFGKSVFDAKKAMCSEFGFLGVSPLDGELNLEGLAPFAQGVAIYRGNLVHMDRCDHRQYDAVSRCKHGRRDSI
jgi:nucleoside 2-deoxyribosyltransferase